MYVAKEKNRFSECYKKVLYAGPKRFDKLKPKPTLKPSPPQKSRPDSQLCFCYFDIRFDVFIDISDVLATNLMLTGLLFLFPTFVICLG